jgi:hypothetical protein
MWSCIVTGKRLIGLALAGFVLFAAGCAGYGSYPGIEGDSANHDPNTLWMQRTMAEALIDATTRYPVDGPYAVNLPEGLAPSRMEIVLSWLGDEDANLLTQETADLPRYHVSRIWIRAQNAEVDVLTPRPEAVGPGGEAVYQPVTFYLHGGSRKWRVTSSRLWAIGSREAPVPNWADVQERSPATAGAGDDS